MQYFYLILSCYPVEDFIPACPGWVSLLLSPQREEASTCFKTEIASLRSQRQLKDFLDKLLRGIPALVLKKRLA